MCFALFMIMLDNTVVNVALPSIERDLGSSLSSLEWIINGYTLAFAVFLATGGRLGDIFGRRLTFLIGVALFSISSATAGFAPDTTLLVGSRIVQGIGGARQGDRHVGRRLGLGAGDRPCAGRVPDRGRFVASHLLHQSSGWHRRRP